MKKNLLNAFLLALFFASIVPQTFALELKVSDDGTVYFYNNNVLGDESGVDEEAKELIRTTIINDGKILVENNDSMLRVDLKRNKQNLKIEESGFKELESAEVERLKIELPTNQTEKQLLRNEARKTKIENLNQSQNEMIEKLREERKLRIEEKIELRNKQGVDGDQELELETRGISATLKNADFEYDQETGILSVTTKNGEVHELNHLPDQAIEKIMANRGEELNKDEVEIEVNDDGTTEYKVNATKKTKLFGLISRKINTQIVLNDDTGEITENEIENTTVLGKLLDNLSF